MLALCSGHSSLTPLLLLSHIQRVWRSMRSSAYLCYNPHEKLLVTPALFQVGVLHGRDQTIMRGHPLKVSSSVSSASHSGNGNVTHVQDVPHFLCSVRVLRFWGLQRRWWWWWWRCLLIGFYHTYFWKKKHEVYFIFLMREELSLQLQHFNISGGLLQLCLGKSWCVMFVELRIFWVRNCRLIWWTKSALIINITTDSEVLCWAYTSV